MFWCSQVPLLRGQIYYNAKYSNAVSHVDNRPDVELAKDATNLTLPGGRAMKYLSWVLWQKMNRNINHITVCHWKRVKYMQTYHKLFAKFALSRHLCGLLQFHVPTKHISSWYDCFHCLASLQYSFIYEFVLVLGKVNVSYKNHCLKSHINLAQKTYFLPHMTVILKMLPTCSGNSCNNQDISIWMGLCKTPSVCINYNEHSLFTHWWINCGTPLPISASAEFLQIKLIQAHTFGNKIHPKYGMMLNLAKTVKYSC